MHSPSLLWIQILSGTMRKQAPLFQSHIDLAHSYWKRIVLGGDLVIDATCGNGHDTLFLAQLNLSEQKKGKLIAIDRQQQAISATQSRLSINLEPELLKQIDFYCGCHSIFPKEISQGTVKLIVYNLGYLPGSDKTLTTMTNTTCKSLENALALICPGGVISMTCYPGHPEGRIEEERILQFSKTLSPEEWSCCYHQWTNRKDSPGLLLFQKLKHLK